MNSNEQKLTTSKTPLAVAKILASLEQSEANSCDLTSDLLPNTLQNAIGWPTINDLAAKVGRHRLEYFIGLQLVKIAEHINTFGNFSEVDMRFLPSRLFDRWGHWSLADFKICFENGIMGDYGEIKHMDAIVLRSWMARHEADRQRLAERQEQMARLREAMAPAPPAQEVRARYQEWYNQVIKNVEVEKISGTEAEQNGQYETRGRKVKKTSISTNYRWFTVGNKQIQALDQAHAERLVERSIRLGEYTREYIYGDPGTNQDNTKA